MSINASPWRDKEVLVLSPTPTHPTDFGNRRRIYVVCSTLASLGAKISFVHYASEADFRHRIRIEHTREMARQWEDYHCITPTRDVHAHAKAEFHEIDEWWDPAIGEKLQWIFNSRKFDVFIVNYTWLSKAFDYAPVGVLKILDTHDQFSGRKEILLAHGIAPEFFYTTMDQECIGIRRADVIWAIKQTEQRYFQGITSKKTLTLLHSELDLKIIARPKTSITRFGIFGARNHVNMINIIEFLDVAAEFISRTLLPMQIVIAGSCCDLLKTDIYPFVEKKGRVETVEDFYQDVDVVLGPMRFSTGLKIKIGECLGFGKALISHAHCFEGYFPVHAFHSLRDYGEMLEACSKVVSNPAIIDELEDASLISAAKARRYVFKTFSETLEFSSNIDGSFVFLISASDLSNSSIVFQHLIQAARYVRHQTDVVFCLINFEGSLSEASTFTISELGKLGQIIRISDQSALNRNHKTYWESIPHVSLDFITNSNILGIWLGSIPTWLQFLPSVCAKRIVAPLSVLRLMYNDNHIINVLSRLKNNDCLVSITDINPTRLYGHLVDCGIKGHFQSTLWKPHDTALVQNISSAKKEHIIIFFQEESAQWSRLTIDVIHLLTDINIIILVDAKSKIKTEFFSQMTGQIPEVMIVDDYTKYVESNRSGPIFAIEIGYCVSLAIMRELFGFCGILVVSLFTPRLSNSEILDPDRLVAHGPGHSMNYLLKLLTDPALLLLPEKDSSLSGLANDAGWTKVWSMVATAIKREYS